MKYTWFFLLVLAAYACDEGGSDVGRGTLNSSVPVYEDLWNPEDLGETEIKIRGIQLGEEEMATAGLGADDGSRVEFRIFRTSGGELTAAIDLYSATGNHLGNGEHSYGIGSHTNWNHYADTDSYGMNIRIQHRRSGRYIYLLSPAINGLVAKKAAQADTAKRAPPDSVFTLAAMPPPERGMILTQDSANDSRCMSVRIKSPQATAWEKKLPRIFETEDGSALTTEGNNDLANAYLRCLRNRKLLK